MVIDMRCIDADALKEKAWDADTRCGYVQVVDVGDIDEAPTIEPESHWIPCSERLPEEYGNYLVTTHDGNVDIGTIDPKNKNMWTACDADGFYWLGNVVAWMPLPSAYR